MNSTPTLKERVSQISIAIFILTVVVMLTGFTLYSIKKSRISEEHVATELKRDIVNQANLFLSSFLLPEQKEGVHLLLEKIIQKENLEGAKILASSDNLPTQFAHCELTPISITTCASSNLKSTAIIYPLKESSEHFGYLIKYKKNISPSFLKNVIEIAALILFTLSVVFFVFYYFLTRLLAKTLPEALESLVEWIEDDLSGTGKKNVTLPFLELEDLKIKISEVMEKYNHSVKKTVKYELARQIVHDLKGPIETLESILKTRISKGSFAESVLIEDCLYRINQLADSVLSIEKQNPYNERINSIDIKRIISSILIEKSIGLKERKIEIHFVDLIKFQKLQIKGNELDFYRAISNVIKNANDSMSNIGGLIEVRLSVTNNSYSISIRDQGIGMSNETISKVLKGGFTSKSSGNGLGFTQVRETIEKMGGLVQIDSILGVGTNVCFNFPIEKIEVLDLENVVLIDDDKLIRMNWKIQADKLGINLKCFESVDEFLNASVYIPKNTIICIDSCLQNGEKGEISSKKIVDIGFETIFLATSLDDIDLRLYPWINSIVDKKPIFA